ncbi:hypothetical protein DITRI_Ditri06bG0098100 [Diplodiscus trichospermus]
MLFVGNFVKHYLLLFGYVVICEVIWLSYGLSSRAHIHHEKYLNKKIEMYDEMTLIVGKDIATISFAKSFADLDMDTEIDSTPFEDDVDFEEVKLKTHLQVAFLQLKGGPTERENAMLI